jgi:hypothetical protein
MKNEQWPSHTPPAPSPAAPPVRVLMADGKWKVPTKKRPKLAPPPEGESYSAYTMARSLAWAGERNR